ncbi:MAG TPA: hypothetical protein VEZ90_01955, partial [Blastocatellia bacterium]|nr:hypothetical protein [Blastocatellia bacterium]
YQRDQLLTMIDQNAAQQAVGNGKVDQALDLISQMPRPQQCELLIQLAESSGVQQADKKVGLNILDRARSTLPPQPQNYLQLQSLMKLAGAYSKFDAKRGLALISDAMGRINSLAAAAQVMEGFDVQGNFKEGELVITPRAQLTTALQALGGQLAALAASDFKGAINACSLLDRADSRAMVELEMVQQILGDQGSQEGALRAPQGANMTMTVDNF